MGLGAIGHPRLRKDAAAALAVFAALALTACGSGSSPPRGTRTPESPDAIFSRLPAPRPGDWLYEHPEAGQPYPRFLAGMHHHLRRDPGEIALVTVGPLSDAQRSTVATMRRFLSAFFGSEPGQLPSRPMGIEDVPPSARRAGPLGEPQVATTWLLGRLVSPGVASRSTLSLALTGWDLWPGPGWNYVFGQTSPDGLCSVLSLRRLGGRSPSGEDPETLNERALKLSAHELCHALGMKHCTAYMCLMNGCNSLEELDRSPLHLCPECLPKLLHATGGQRRTRYLALARFARDEGMATEAAFYARAAAIPDDLWPWAKEDAALPRSCGGGT